MSAVVLLIDARGHGRLKVDGQEIEDWRGVTIDYAAGNIPQVTVDLDAYPMAVEFAIAEITTTDGADDLTAEEVAVLFPGAVPGRLADPAECPRLGNLICTRLDAHDRTRLGGHTYEPAGFPDGHDASEARAEETRS